MEDILNSEWALGIATFVLGYAVAFLSRGLSALIAKIEGSPNKLDDLLLPLLNDIRDAVNKNKDDE